MAKYYASRKDDPYFIQLTEILSPVVNDVLSGKQDACRKAIQLMHAAITRIPAKRFKDPEYTQQIFNAVKSYLSDDDQLIKSLARKRRTDRLEVSKTIASDCLEFFSFLPMQLETDPQHIQKYVGTMDNIFMLIRKIEHRKSQFKQLRDQLMELN